jgi:hypothetical protein
MKRGFAISYRQGVRMVFQVPQFWNIAGDGFQILLCLLMLSLFIKNRTIQKRIAVNKAKSVTNKSFNTHIFGIAVEQQLSQAFSNIIETITAERNGLENLIGLNPLNHDDEYISKIRTNTHFSDLNGHQRLVDERIRSAERLDKIRKLAANGLTARRISKELKISMSEVELILSLGEK